MQQTNKPWRLVATLSVAAAVGSYVLYDRQQFRDAVQAREKLRAEKVAAAEAARAQERQALQLAERELRARREAAKRAAMTPGQLRRERLEEQFSAWDGSHRAAEAAIKARLDNPKSYEHDRTTYADKGIGRGITVNTVFRATNPFNAVVRNVAVVELDESGNVTSVKIGR